MKLKDYMDLKKITQEDAAREIDISRVWLNAILKGKATPGIKAVKGIIRWSEGAVRLEDLI